MAKNTSFYISNENEQDFAEIDNKSEFLNGLMSREFSNNKENLMKRLLEKEGEVKVLKVKIQNIENEEQRIDMINHQKKMEHSEQKEKDDLIERLNNARNNDLIEDVDYWGAYDEERKQFDLKKVKRILNKLDKKKE